MAEILLKVTLSTKNQSYHIILSRVHIAWAGLELRTIVVICIDCIGRFKSNYHTTTTHDGLYISSSKYERKHGLCISMLECLIDITFWYRLWISVWYISWRD
jgi:hypothetical protein